jgi:CubicO group peptidase (beta-lactamase class C family)
MLGEDGLIMQRRQMLAGLLGLGATGLISPELAWALKTPIVGSDYPKLRAALNSIVGQGKLPGALASVGRGTAPATFITAGTRGFGLKEAVDPDTLWRVYSMTKPITGIATMMLIEQGKLKLDQPLADLIPEFSKMMVQNTPDGSVDDVRPAKTQITIRHLLTHTAGLGYSISQKGPIQKAYYDKGLIPGKISKLPLPGFPSKVEVAPSLAEFSKRLATLPLVHEPGTKWDYSVSIDLLGRVIEIVSSLPFDAYLQTNLFAPLGMTSSFFMVPKSESARMTTNYGVQGKFTLPIDAAASSLFYDKPEFPFGGAGLVMSARDHDRFQAMLLGMGMLGKARIMKAATARLAMSNLMPAGASTKGSLVDGQGFGAGGRVSLPGYSAGAGIFGWGGAAGTISFVDPKRNLRMSGYIQAMLSDAYPLTKLLVPALLQDLGEKPVMPT